MEFISSLGIKKNIFIKTKEQKSLVHFEIIFNGTVGELVLTEFAND